MLVSVMCGPGLKEHEEAVDTTGIVSVVGLLVDAIVSKVCADKSVEDPLSHFDSD